MPIRLVHVQTGGSRDTGGAVAGNPKHGSPRFRHPSRQFDEADEGMVESRTGLPHAPIIRLHIQGTIFVANATHLA